MAFQSSADNPSSRYVIGGNVDVFPNRLGWWERKIFYASSDDLILILTPKYHQRPEILAYDVYGKATYAWLVLQFNNILDVTTEFVVGKEIHLPTPRRVLLS
jgi:hypothetical protein